MRSIVLFICTFLPLSVVYGEVDWENGQLYPNYMVASPWGWDDDTIEYHKVVMDSIIQECAENNSVCALVQQPEIPNNTPGYKHVGIYEASIVGDIEDCEDNPEQPKCEDKNNNNNCPSTDSPIVLSTGRKYLNEVDYRSINSEALSFSRYFNYVPNNAVPALSYRDLWTFGRKNNRIDTSEMEQAYSEPALQAVLSGFGEGWSLISMFPSTHHMKLILEGKQYSVSLKKSVTAGKAAQKTSLVSDSNVQSINDPRANINVSVKPYSYNDVDGHVPQTYSINRADGSTEFYDEGGYLASIQKKNGEVLTYVNSESSLTITSSFGGTISLTTVDEFHSVLEDPAGNQTHYYFDPATAENPTLRVVYPDNTPNDQTDNPVREYVHISAFDEDGKPTLLNGALKSIYDNGKLYLEYDYNPVTGMAIHSNKAGGLESKDIDYTIDEATNRVTTAKVTNAFGKDTIYHFETVNGVQEVSRVEGIAAGSCVASDSYYTYDNNGYRKTKTSARGHVTETLRNDLGLPGTITSGLIWTDASQTNTATTKDTTTTTITWIEGTSQTDVITTENLTTDYDYYAENNRLKQITQTDTTSYTNAFGSTKDQARVWDYSYTYYSVEGIPENTLLETMTIDGSLAGAGDTSVYTWNQQGNLVSVKNAKNHITTYGDHTGNGQPQSITDLNDVITRLEYHPRGWIEKVTVEAPGDDRSLDAVTTYKWYLNGTLEQVTLPGDSFVHYTYNDARHLTEIRNNLDETITFTTNDEGEWTLAETKNVSATLKRQQQRAFDLLGRLKDVFGNNNQHTHYEYDVNNNLKTIEQYGEGNRTLNTTLNYDALDRLEEEVKAIQHIVNGSAVPADVQTTFTYDTQNNLKTVTDPENRTTTYWTNGFGERVRTVSPDTITTDYWYDLQGNLSDKRDARGVLIKYHYDALGRLEHIEYLGNSAEDVRYYYDEVSGSNPYAKGRLTRVTDQSGVTRFEYDHRGNVVTDRRTIQSKTYTTRYAYNLADNVITVTYASGRIVNYQRNDVLGRISGVTTQEKVGATAVTLTENITYLPFGPITQFDYGNGLTRQIPYDLDYRLDKITVGNALKIDVGYDWFNNISSLDNMLDSSRNQSFVYDDLHRLQDAYGSYGSGTDQIHYEYDLVGNRQLLQQLNAGSVHTGESYQYYDDSHRLEQITKTTGAGDQTRHFIYDEAGNIDVETTLAGKTRTFVHGENNRLIQVEENASVIGDYDHNALGQRVIKDANGKAQHFHFGLMGELLGEGSSEGNITREYVYLNGQMIAMITVDKVVEPVAESVAGARPSQGSEEPAIEASGNGSAGSGGAFQWPLALVALLLTVMRRRRKVVVNHFAVFKALTLVLVPLLLIGCGGGSATTETNIYYVHADHLGTPKAITDKDKKAVWEVDSKPFGEVEVLTADIEFNVRFPGQYADGETGLSYNYFRDYDSSIGRYLQSDPIGLSGGLNTYAYVGGNPLLFVDFFGLATQVSVGVSASVLAGFPQFGFFGAGGGGGTSVGISIPDNFTNWRCYQAFIQTQANAGGGWGIFAGIGVVGSITSSEGPITSSSSSGIVIEGNAGWGLAGGVSATASGDVTNPSDWLNPIDSVGGSPAPKVGLGFGLAAFVGQFWSSTLATPVSGDSCECE